MTRVLHVMCDLSGGGAERLVLDLARRAPSDFTVEVAAVQAGGTLGPAFAAAEVPVRLAGRERGRLGLRATARLAAWAARVDVVHTHLWAGDSWGRVGGWLGGAPVQVSTEHNIDRDEAQWKRRWKDWSSRRIERIVAVSDAVARHLAARGVRRVQVIPNGVDLGRFGPHRGGGGVLFVGRLVEQKGVDVLLEAVAGLGTPVRVVGTGPLDTRLRATAPPHVQFLGPREDVPELLAQADVLVVPSRWEGFGLVAVEGMAAGVPVVASAVDGLRDVVGAAGILVAPDDAPALRAALDRLQSRPQLGAELGRAGRLRAQQFGIEAMIAAYYDLYRELSSDR